MKSSKSHKGLSLYRTNDDEPNTKLTIYDKKKFIKLTKKGPQNLLLNLSELNDLNILNDLDNMSFDDEINNKVRHVFQSEHIDEFISMLTQIFENYNILNQVDNSMAQYLELIQSSKYLLSKKLKRHRQNCIKIIQKYDELIKNVCYLCNMVYENYHGTNIYTFMIFVADKIYNKQSSGKTNELELENISIQIQNSILVFYEIALKYYDNNISKSEYLDQVEIYDTLLGTTTI